MAIEYYFDSFMYVMESPTYLRMSLIDDDALMYHLHFESDKECGKYQRMLHEIHQDPSFSEIVVGEGFMRHLVRNNPFEYGYKLSEEDFF